jgi:hypothetical protein
MAIASAATNLNYLEDDTGINTRINIFKYQRPRPNAKMLRVPVSFMTLPLPINMPTDHYSMNIGETDLGFLGNATDFKKNAGLDKLEASVKEKLQVGGVSGDVATLAVALLAASPGISDTLSGIAKNLGGLNVSGVAQATAGLVKNPHTALLFNNVQLRTFTFQWKLSPRSEAQSRNLNKIINMLKRAMHPSFAGGGFALEYPNLFTVEFNNDKEGIVTVDYAFLQDFQINPTPNGQVYYRNGYPSIVEMSMTFKETRIKTTEDFADLDINTNLSSGSARAGGSGM